MQAHPPATRRRSDTARPLTGLTSAEQAELRLQKQSRLGRLGEGAAQYIHDAGEAASNNNGLGLALSGANSLAHTLPPLLDALNFLSSIHPWISLIVGTFRVIAELELKRHATDKKVVLLLFEMRNMMAVLLRLEGLHEKTASPEGRTIAADLEDVLKEAKEDIKSCGNVCDAYSRKRWIVKIIQTKSWDDIFTNYSQRFSDHKERIHVSINLHTNSMVRTANEQLAVVLKKMDVVLEILSKTAQPERQALENIMLQQGGLNVMFRDEVAFRNILRAEKRVEADLLHASETAGGFGISVSSGSSFAPAYHLYEAGIQRKFVRSSESAPKPYYAASTPRTFYTPFPGDNHPHPFDSRHLAGNKATGRVGLTPTLSFTANELANLAGEKVIWENSTLQEERTRLLKDLEDQPTTAIDNNFPLFMRKYQIQQKQIEELSKDLVNESDRKIDPVLDGPHAKINDIIMRKIWKDMRWRGIVKARHLILAIHDYYTQWLDDQRRVIALRQAQSGHPSGTRVQQQSGSQTRVQQRATNSPVQQQRASVPRTKQQPERPSATRTRQHRAPEPPHHQYRAPNPLPSVPRTKQMLEHIIATRAGQQHSPDTPHHHQRTSTSPSHHHQRAPGPSPVQPPAVTVSESELWALESINLMHLHHISEALDSDSSGFITIQEVNRFTASKPEGWSLLRWLAYWAIGWRASMTEYRRKIWALLAHMNELQRSVSSCNAAIASYLERVVPLVETMTANFSEHAQTHFVLRHFQQYVDQEEQRIITALEHVHYDLDGLDTLALISGPRWGLERNIFVILYLLLRRHGNIMHGARKRILDPRELSDAAAAIKLVLDAFNYRAQDLTRLFGQRWLNVGLELDEFACGMLSQCSPTKNARWPDIKQRMITETLDLDRECATPQDTLPFKYPCLSDCPKSYDDVEGECTYVNEELKPLLGYWATSRTHETEETLDPNTFALSFHGVPTDPSKVIAIPRLQWSWMYTTETITGEFSGMTSDGRRTYIITTTCKSSSATPKRFTVIMNWDNMTLVREKDAALTILGPRPPVVLRKENFPQMVFYPAPTHRQFTLDALLYDVRRLFSWRFSRKRRDSRRCLASLMHAAATTGAALNPFDAAEYTRLFELATPADLHFCLHAALEPDSFPWQIRPCWTCGRVLTSKSGSYCSACDLDA